MILAIVTDLRVNCSERGAEMAALLWMKGIPAERGFFCA